jgi:hypothetical protein
MNDDDARPVVGGRADVVGHPYWMAQDEFTRVFGQGDPAVLADAIGQSVRWVWGADGQRWFDYPDARRWKAAQDPAVSAFHLDQQADDAAWRARRDVAQ